MALAITSITPNTGVSSGWDRVIIEGTDFDMHPFPPTQEGYVGKPSPWPAVKVFFGDVETNPKLIEIYPKPGGAAGERIIECSTPRYHGDPRSLPVAVDLKVENMINPGSVTAAGLFTFEKPSALTQSVLNLVTKGLLLQLWRQIPFKRVAQRVHTKYDEDRADGLNIVQLADVPALIAYGPSIDRSDGPYRQQDEILVDEVDQQGRFRQPTNVDLVFTLEITDEHMGRLLNLVDALTRFVDENGWLEVEQVPNDPTQGIIKFDMDWIDIPDLHVGTNIDNLVTASGRIAILGVPLDRTSRIRLGTASEIDDLVFDMRRIESF